MPPASSTSPARFASDTAVERIAAGTYRAKMSPAWWIMRGPNGGYVAATLVRALEAEVGDPGRPPRSLTIHYLRPPAEGEVVIEATVERAGRSVTSLSARMIQQGSVVALALASFGVARPGVSFDDTATPDVPRADSLPVWPPGAPVPFHERFEHRRVFGEPAVAGRKASANEVGGWIRPVEPAPVDYALVAQLTDAWTPVSFSRLAERVAVPTVDLTIHFRQPPPGTPEWCLVRFRSNLARDGFVEEDGEVWSADGRLLAQSRQLAALLV